MRNDGENHKYANWRVHYLFANYLFGKNFGIVANIELMFVSLVAICQAANDPARERTEREEQHRLKMMTLFASVVDFYDVVFKSFSRGLASYLAGKKLNADTIKNYLRMAKIGDFFLQSGKKTLVSAGSKRREDLNFKFLKMLLARSVEFASFVELVCKKEVEEHLDVVEFQCITILHQLMREAEEKKKKREAAQLTAALPHVSAADQSDEETPLEADGQQAAKQIGRVESEAIMFQEEEDETGLQLGKRPSVVDDKTKKYLALVKQLQYEDEYDDTHDLGEGRPQRRANRGRRREERAVRDKSEDSEFEEDEVARGSGFPVEQENEDSGEDIDPMNRWERTQSNMQEDSEVPLQRNPSRGGRGARGRGQQGRGSNRADGRRERYEPSRQGGARGEDGDRDHYGGERGQYQRRDDGRPARGGDRDFHGRGREERDDYQSEYRERGGRERGGQQGRGRPGHRDTR